MFKDRRNMAVRPESDLKKLLTKPGPGNAILLSFLVLVALFFMMKLDLGKNPEVKNNIWVTPNFTGNEVLPPWWMLPSPEPGVPHQVPNWGTFTTLSPTQTPMSNPIKIWLTEEKLGVSDLIADYIFWDTWFLAEDKGITLHEAYNLVMEVIRPGYAPDPRDEGVNAREQFALWISSCDPLDEWDKQMVVEEALEMVNAGMNHRGAFDLAVEALFPLLPGCKIQEVLK